MRSSNAKVLIVESFTPDDLLHELREARVAGDVLRLLNVPALVREVTTKQDLETACKVFSAGNFDVLHVACHGYSSCTGRCEGISLTDGTHVNWADLAKTLGEAINGKTLVVSACQGGCEQLPAIFERVEHRPSAIIGPRDDIGWDSLVVGLLVYYRSVYPLSDKPDSPCVAVSRAELAAGSGLVLHLYNQASQRYEKHTPHPVCSIEVLVKTHGISDTRFAASALPFTCCGEGVKWGGAETILAEMKSAGKELVDIFQDKFGDGGL